MTYHPITLLLRYIACLLLGAQITAFTFAIKYNVEALSDFGGFFIGLVFTLIAMAGAETWLEKP
jgi:hypothetical protein